MAFPELANSHFPGLGAQRKLHISIIFRDVLTNDAILRLMQDHSIYYRTQTQSDNKSTKTGFSLIIICVVVEQTLQDHNGPCYHQH